MELEHCRLLAECEVKGAVRLGLLFFALVLRSCVGPLGGFIHCGRPPPGSYSLSISSDGQTGRAMLNLKSQTTEIAGDVHMPADSRARNALFVECVGKSHRLSAIHVKEMEVVLDSDSQVEHASDGKPRRTEKLLLTSTSPQK